MRCHYNKDILRPIQTFYLILPDINIRVDKVKFLESGTIIFAGNFLIDIWTRIARRGRWWEFYSAETAIGGN